MKDERLTNILDRLSNILDMAYEYAEDDDTKTEICDVEEDLHDYLREKGFDV